MIGQAPGKGGVPGKYRPLPVELELYDLEADIGETKNLAAAHPEIHVLHRQEKNGLGRAYLAGFKWALEHSYEFIFEMDADFSHNPADLPRILSAAQTADLALGSRYVGGIRIINWPLSRLILSKGAAVYVRLITGMPFTDPTGGFKCYRRAVLESIDLDRIQSNGYSFQIEMTHEAWIRGFHMVDVPITFEERRSGQSKMSSKIVREALWMVWTLLFHNRLKRTASKMRNPRSVLATEIKP
jgi:dolichol-phosphate mannosyltransferase